MLVNATARLLTALSTLDRHRVPKGVPMLRRLQDCAGQSIGLWNLPRVAAQTFELIAPLQRPSALNLARLTLVGAAYFTLAVICAQLASIYPDAVPICAATGMAIAALLLWGYRVFPAIFIAAFLVSNLSASSMTTSLGIAFSKTLEPMAVVYLYNCLKTDGPVFETPTNVVKFFLASVAVTTIAAAIGSSWLMLSGDGGDFLPLWLVWWLGDLAGALVVTPVIALWSRSDPISFTSADICRSAATYLVAAALASIAFSPLLQHAGLSDALGFLVILPMLYAAVRQGPRDTATVSLIICFFAYWGTLFQGGPFAQTRLSDSSIVLLVFFIGISIPALALSAEVLARRRIETKQRQHSLEAEVLWQATEQAAAGGSFDKLLHACLQRICRVAGWAAGHVYLPDDIDDPQCLQSSAVWHFERKALKSISLEVAGIDRKRGQGLPGRIWASGRPKWVPDISQCDQPDRKHILLKHGFRAAFGFPIYAEGKLQAVLEFFSTEKKPPDKDLMCVVQGIGEQLGRVIERKRAQEQQAALETTLNALTLAIYFTDIDGRIAYMNRAAQQQIKTTCGLRNENDQLVPTDQTAHHAFKKALEIVTTIEGHLPISESVIPLPARDKPGLIAVILPLDSSELRSVCGTVTATAAVLVQDSTATPLFIAEAFATLYGLTRSELRVLLAMRPGLSLRQAAETLGVSEATAKTHLQHVYAKTHTCKQSELLYLLMRFTPPIVPHEAPATASIGAPAA